MLDATIVNVALARIGTDLDAGFSELQWMTNAYTLTLAALILLGGSLGDILGHRRVFVLGTTWFAAASVLCAVSPNAEVLIASRALQGMGAALLTPGSLAIISSTFRAQDRARAIGAWSGLGGIAGAIGPFLGGWLVEADWRLVFVVNLPLAAVVIWIALRHVPVALPSEHPPTLDIPGIALIAVFLAGLTYALTAVGGSESSAGAIVSGVVGVLALVMFVVVERRSAHPVIPGVVARDRAFVATNVVTVFVYAALSVFLFLIVLQLQVVGGLSPVRAGTSLLPVTGLMLILSARFGALAEKVGPRLLMTVGPIVIGTGLLWCLRIGAGSSYLTSVLPAVTLVGLGLSCTVAPLTSTVLSSVPNALAGTASGINNAIARSAGLLAIAVVPAVAGLTGGGYDDPDVFDRGFGISMVIAAVLMYTAALVAFVSISPRRVPVDRVSHCSVSGPPPVLTKDRG